MKAILTKIKITWDRDSARVEAAWEKIPYPIRVAAAMLGIAGFAWGTAELVWISGE